MRIGLRGHDVSADNPEELCRKIVALGVNEIQLVVHKSFPDFQYNAENIQVLANVFVQNHIQVAVYGCYIDPLTPSGQERFLEHIRYAKKLNADVIATESAIGTTQLQEDEQTYIRLVSAFRKFADEGSRQGVKVAIETVYVHPICDPQKTLRLLNDVQSDNLYVILDPQNLAHSENDPHQNDRAQEAIRLYGDKIVAIHWKAKTAATDDPLIGFAKNNKNTVLITEGLTGENLFKFMNQIQKENK